jgi:hypothetical protein
VREASDDKRPTVEGSCTLMAFVREIYSRGLAGIWHLSIKVLLEYYVCCFCIHTQQCAYYNDTKTMQSEHIEGKTTPQRKRVVCVR